MTAMFTKYMMKKWIVLSMTLTVDVHSERKDLMRNWPA